jgi:regulator of sigma E protease
MSVILLILGLIMFMGLVVVHEFGHFIAARKGGVDVEEFGLGFPPKAWGKKLASGMELTINWLPLGGFVRLKGEHDSATAKGSYGAAPLGVKVRIMIAGVIMNLVTAFLLFTFLALIGLPKIIDNQFTVGSDTKITNNRVLIGSIARDSPSEKAGLKQRDQIVKVTAKGSTYPINATDDLPKATKALAGQEVVIEAVRDGEPIVVRAKLLSREAVDTSKNTANPKGYLGISPFEITMRRSTWSAPIVAVGLIRQISSETLKALGSMVGNAARGNGAEASKQVSGPIGIFSILKESSSLGIRFVLMIIALISLTLAIMNALPIPALDGGRLYLTLFYRLIRKPLKQSTEDKVHGTGFVVLMLLFLLITFVDIQRIIAR